MTKISTWTELLKERTKDGPFPYREGLEAQFEPLKDDDAVDRHQNNWPIPGSPYPYRIPKDGDTVPVPNDGPVGYHPNLIRAAGMSGWNWKTEQTEHGFCEFDFGHGPHPLDDEGIRKIDELAEQLACVNNMSSRGGKGRHWNILITTPLPARTRKDNARNQQAIFDALCAMVRERFSIDLTDYVCAVGGIQYIFSCNPAPDGFRLIKAATGTLDVAAPVSEPKKPETEDPPEKYPKTKRGPKHREHCAWIEGQGLGEWNEKEGHLETHTKAVEALCEALDLKGDYQTDSPGKSLPKGRNCRLYPEPRGVWRCIRFGTVTESGPGWTTSKHGHSTCFVNKAVPKAGEDPAEQIVRDSIERDKFFHSPDGTAYVEVLRHGHLDILLVAGDDYRRILRTRYREKTHHTSRNEWLKNAVGELEAHAIENAPEFPICVRVGWHGGKLYIDVCNQERDVIEIDDEGYRAIKAPPVRFLRTSRMQSLPFPQSGGTLADLRPFCNVNESDWPLFVGVLIGMFHPTGPYPVILLIGGDGHAKSSLARLIHAFVDPNIATACAPPASPEDLLLMARQRWLVGFDNLTEVVNWLADAMCRMSTGGGSERRTKYKDSDTSLFVAKRPQLVTSIQDIITRPDLLSRTIKFDLPRLTEQQRKTEDEFNNQLQIVQDKVFGLLLTGLSSAIKNQAETKKTIAGLPRLADWAVWVQASEEGLGFDEGAILKTYWNARKATVDDILSCELATQIKGLADKGFTGSGTALAKRLGKETSRNDVQQMVGELRDLQSTLESQGIGVSFHRSHGVSQILIEKIQSGIVSA